MSAEETNEQVAVVTGAARGIGRRVALALAERGYAVAANDLSSPEEALIEFEQVGAEALAISGDVSDEEATLADWNRILAVNLTGPFLMSREFGKEMLRQGSGSIVNISSVAGLLGVSDRAAYNASKHGLIGLTRTLAAEWGGRGGRVNAVCPGGVKTEMDDEDQGAGGYTDAGIEGRIPMARLAIPEDIARAVAFLADPEWSGFV